jgi:polysaccharide biosynthesis transport protein
MVDETRPAEPPRAEALPQGFVLRQYLDILLRWKWAVLAAVAVTISASALWTFSRTRVFRSSASVLISKAPAEVLGSHVREVVDPSRESYANEEYIQNQIAVACSTEVALAAATRLHLQSNPLFWSPEGKASFRVAFSAEDAASMVLGVTGCSVRRKTTILDITVDHHDPRLAAQIANAMVQAYIDKNLENRISSTVGAVKWLSKQLDDLRLQLDTSEKSLYAFKRKNNLLSVPLAGQQNLLTRDIERYNDELAATRIKRMALASRIEQLKTITASDPLETPEGPLLEGDIMRRLKAAYIEERRRFIALKERYLSKHPLVQEQQVRMSSAAADFQREVRNQIAGLVSSYRQVIKHEGQLAAAIQSTKGEALELGRKEETYQQLNRPVETTRKLYELLLSRMKESDLLGHLRTNNLSVLERAEPSFAPVSPRVKLNLMIGALLGVLLGLGLAFVLESLDNSIKSEEDISLVSGATCLGAIPKISTEIKSTGDVHPMLMRTPALIVHHRPMSVAAESWRAMRTNLLFTSPDRPVKTIVVTSPSPQEGKTTISIGLATAIAQAGKPVLLIDADLRQPRLHQAFGLAKELGLTTALREERPVEELIKTTEVPNLFLLPSGPVPPNPAELCHSERLFQLVKFLEQRYDRIFLDAPPALLVTDPVLLAARFDAAILVVRTGQTTKKALQDCHRQLCEVGANVIGCVLNDMDITQRGYRYYPYRRRAYRYGLGYGPDAEEKVKG